MNTLDTLTQRIRLLLQDPDRVAWDDAQIRRELHYTLLRVARQLGAQDLVWCQATKDKTHYPLNEQALTQAAGTDTSGGTGNLTTLHDDNANFLAVPGDVATNDRVRNLHDGSVGVITSGTATTLVCAEGFSGGTQNAISHGDVYLVERPMEHRLVLEVHAVLYDGQELWPMTQDAMDRLAPGWERQRHGPKYWSVDQAVTPSVVQIHPAPLVTGSSVPTFPMSPLAMPWQENLVLVLSESPEDTLDAEETFHWLDWYADLVVFDTVARLTSFPGEWQALSVSAGCTAVADLYRTRGVP